MSGETPEIAAARQLAAQTLDRLKQSAAFQQLPLTEQQQLMGDLATVQAALQSTPSAAEPHTRSTPDDPYALSLADPRLLRRGRSTTAPPNGQDGNTQHQKRRSQPATETLAERTGALIDEVDFAGFVAGLVHGTFDAVVDAAIRQMESFGDLISSVAKNADDFSRDNVTANQARDWLGEQHPGDVSLTLEPTPRLSARKTSEGDYRSPSWLDEFGLAGEELTDELLESQLVPAVRERIGNNRLQTLATMVLMGMNRINVTDGSISARVRFRAAARDKTAVDFATSQDPAGSGGGWGRRASGVGHNTMVSTVGVNAQADSGLKAELFGEVKINFATETLPLDRFVEQAQMTLLQRNARVSSHGSTTNAAPPAAPEPVADEPAATHDSSPDTGGTS